MSARRLWLGRAAKPPDPSVRDEVAELPLIVTGLFRGGPCPERPLRIGPHPSRTFKRIESAVRNVSRAAALLASRKGHDMTRKPNALREWRTQRIEILKTTHEFNALGPGPKRLALHMIRGYDNADGSGMYPAQKRLAAKVGRNRRTIIRWLAQIVASGVFLEPERRYRGGGTQGGRTTNVYRVNPALLRDSSVVDVTQPVTQPVTAEALRAEEALRASEALFESRRSILTDALPSVGRDLLEGDSASTPSLIFSTDRGEPHPLIGGSAQKAPEVRSAREHRQREYEDAYAETDLDAEEFDRQWLRNHPDTDVTLWSGSDIERAFGIHDVNNIEQREALR